MCCASKVRRVAFCPYVPPGRFAEALGLLPCSLDSINLIFAHQEFRNAKLGAFLSETGDEWPVTNPYVVSGHIHQYDLLQPNLLYVGTPLQLAFADSDKKVLLAMDLFNEPDVSRHVPFVVPNLRTIDCSCLPGKKIVHLSSAMFVESYIDERIVPLLGAHHQVRVVVTGTKSQIVAVRSTRLFTNFSSRVQLVTKVSAEAETLLDDTFEDKEETTVSTVLSDGASKDFVTAPRRNLLTFQERLSKALNESGKESLWTLWQTVQSEQHTASSNANASSSSALPARNTGAARRKEK